MTLEIVVPTNKETLVNDAFTEHFGLQEMTGQEKIDFMVGFLEKAIKDIVILKTQKDAVDALELF